MAVRPLRVLVACEFSGTVRDAFIRLGHDAWSCDVLPSELPGPHYQCDVLKVLGKNWDLMIAHPPCTHLAVSGAKHFHRKHKEQQQALWFVRILLSCHIPRICLENPRGIIGSHIQPHTQIIQPYQFGDPFKKETFLWLKNLPRLKGTGWIKPEADVVFKSGKRLPAWYNKASGPNRAKIRSRTFQGIANAMAKQWGNL